MRLQIVGAYVTLSGQCPMEQMMKEIWQMRHLTLTAMGQSGLRNSLE